MKADDILRLIPEEMEAATWLHGYATAVKHLGKDWDSFRREAARDILCAIISDKWATKSTVERAVKLADELVNELKDKVCSTI